MTSRAERLRSAGLDAPLSAAQLARIYEQRTGKSIPSLTSPVVRAPLLIGRRAEVEAIGERLANGIRLVLPGAPRTKKNGTTLGIKQSPAYIRFRDRVKELVAPLAAHLQLPLPDVPMNIAAVYYVDKPGEQADLTGLHQGLFDALQDSGVVSNDWYFRTADGSRVVFSDPKPRVEVTITRIPA
jgi:Holliday junction resolvase RusA-like endonuclease